MQTAFKSQPVNTVGELPKAGDKIFDFELVGTDLSSVKPADLKGKKTILNIFPSVDTGTCAKSVKKFNDEAKNLGLKVINVSMDLPFALGRFNTFENLEHISSASAFRSDFGTKSGLLIADSPLQGLLARAIIVIDENGTVIHSSLVPEITEEPDYDAAIKAVTN